MRNFNQYKKVGLDIFFEQVKWSMWFFAVLVAIHVIVLFFNLGNETEIVGFFEFSRYSTAIFMLVCGIMVAYVFLTTFVQQGISRKVVYMGVVLSAFGLAFAITLFPLLLNGIEFLLADLAILHLNFASYGSSTDWFLETVIYFLNIFTYYLIGWLIGLGYYRYGWLIGFGFIAIAIMAFSLNGYFWGDSGLSSIIPWIPHNPVDASPAIAIAGSLILIAVLLLSMRLLTKRVPIKM